MDKEEIERDMASLGKQRDQLLNVFEGIKAKLQNTVGAILYLEEKLRELKKEEKDVGT